MRPEHQHRLGMVLAGVAVAALATVLFVFPPEEHSFFPRCLFHSWTGLQCPGCGGLRAAHRLLHGDIVGAWRLNALLVLAGPVALVWLLARFVEKHTGRHPLPWLRNPSLLWLLLAVVLGFGIVRNLPI